MQGKGRVLSALIRVVSNITVVTYRYHEGQDGGGRGGFASTFYTDKVREMKEVSWVQTGMMGEAVTR